MLRATLLLACVGLIHVAGACQSTFFTLPSVVLSESPLSKAYLEYPEMEDDVPSGTLPDYLDPAKVAQEFCDLNMPKKSQPSKVGVFKPVIADLTVRLPLVQVSDPSGANVTVCESVGCSIFGVIECVPKGATACTPDAKGNYGVGNSGQNNYGNNNSGSGNMCNGCSGSSNVGDNNAGSMNLGTENSGTMNVGSFNAGGLNVCWNQTTSNIPFAACPPPFRGPYVAE